MSHAQIWGAIDALAARHNLTPSGLARAAGLDPTTFNKSKRVALDGKLRWPSTESLARALDAVGADFDQFASLINGSGGPGAAIPVVAMNDLKRDGFFDAQGFPVGAGETVRFPGLGDERVYALEIDGHSMAPAFRRGDVVIVQPSAPVRRGDRIVLRTRDGQVIAGELGRRNEQVIEALPLNPAYPPRTAPTADVEWIARIVWASQ